MQTHLGKALKDVTADDIDRVAQSADGDGLHLRLPPEERHGVRVVAALINVPSRDSARASAAVADGATASNAHGAGEVVSEHCARVGALGTCRGATAIACVAHDCGWAV